MVTESSDGPGPAERLLQETMDKVTRAGLMMQYQKFYNEQWQTKKMEQLKKGDRPYAAYGMLQNLSKEDQEYYLRKLDEDEVVKNFARKSAVQDLDRWISNYKYNFEYEGEMYKSLERTFMAIRNQVEGRYIKPYELPSSKDTVDMPNVNTQNGYDYFTKRAMRTDQSIKEA